MGRLKGAIMAAAIGGTILLGGASPALAQSSTPIAVDPAECIVAPRAVDELATIFVTGNYVPDAEIAAGNLPEGTPASEDVIGAVNATFRQVIACSNADDLLRTLALFTDSGAQFFGPEESDAPEQQIRDYLTSLKPAPVPAGERELFSPLSDVVVLDDGRVGGLAADPAGDDVAVYLVFVNVDGTWLVDAVVDITGSATPAATPAS